MSVKAVNAKAILVQKVSGEPSAVLFGFFAFTYNLNGDSGGISVPKTVAAVSAAPLVRHNMAKPLYRPHIAT